MFLRTAAEPNSWPPQVEQHVGARPCWKPSRHAKNSALRHAAHKVATRGGANQRAAKVRLRPFLCSLCHVLWMSGQGQLHRHFIVPIWAACYWTWRLEVPTQWRKYYNIIHIRLQDSWTQLGSSKHTKCSNYENRFLSNQQSSAVWNKCLSM